MSAMHGLRDFLLADPPTSAAPRLRLVEEEAEAQPAPRAVVLAAPRTARAAGAAVARGLADGRRGRAAVLLLGGTAPGPAVPATGGARRLARRLAAAGVPARACGSLIAVALPTADEDAADTVAAVAMIAAAATQVLVLAGPRGPALDAVLDRFDVAFVVGEGTLAELAATGLRSRLPVTVVSPRFTLADRLLGYAGLARSATSRVVVPGAAARDAVVTGAAASRPPAAARARAGESGQALVLLLGVLCAVLVGAAVLGSVAQGLGTRDARQRSADLAALAAGRALRDALPRRHEPAWLGRRPNPRHLTRPEVVAHAEAIALATARRNGARRIEVAFPPGAVPTRVTVTIRDPVGTPSGSVPVAAVAEAEVALGAGIVAGGQGATGEYRGPFAVRQGRRMRPDVARAFDRLAAAARAAGVPLVIVSAHRTDAEQAALWRARPDPRWVAPPGRSLHRLGTELDLGPRSTYPWLARHAPRFGFVLRYSWEPWHWGYARSPGTASVGYGAGGSGGDRAPTGRSAVPNWVPSAYAPLIRAAAARWGVGAALLSAQMRAESGFDPRARSPAGALGIAQFMPATARAYGLRDPFDTAAAIDAQAHLMHDLLTRFASVPLALAAYNAGPAPVAACGCVPRYPETQAYVARILALLGHRDAVTGTAFAGPDVRLVR